MAQEPMPQRWHRGQIALEMQPVMGRWLVAWRGKTPPLADQADNRWPLVVVNPVYGYDQWEMWEVPPALDVTIALGGVPEAIWCDRVYHPQGDGETWLYPTDQVTLVWREEITPDDQAHLLDRWGLTWHHDLTGMPRGAVYLLPHGGAVLAGLDRTDQLQREPALLLAELNVLVPLAAHGGGALPMPWHLQHPQWAHVAAAQAWAHSRGDRRVVVAVADMTIDPDHGDLRSVGKIVAPLDLTQEDFGGQGASFQESHGTFCAAIAVGEDQGQDWVGIAPACGLLPIRLPTYLDDDVLEAIAQWCITHGAAVLLCAWGAGLSAYPLSLRQRIALHRLLQEGREGLGCVPVVSAGNSNRPLLGRWFERQWPDGRLQGPTPWLQGLALHPEVIAVAACTHDYHKALYSNWGEEVFLCAPSNNGTPIHWGETGWSATGPLVLEKLPGQSLLTQEQGALLGYNTGYVQRDFGGTSAAAAMVAGVIALMISANPQLTAGAIREILRHTTTPILDPQGDLQLGLGLGRYDHQGHSPWFGYGLIHSDRAVRQAIQYQVPPDRHWRDFSQDEIFAIPDGDPEGLWCRMELATVEALEDGAITVVIDHQSWGDLRLYLHTPWGERILLQDRLLSGSGGFHHTYHRGNCPALETLVQRHGHGPWQLQIVDEVPLDTGALYSWTIHLLLRDP